MTISQEVLCSGENKWRYELTCANIDGEEKMRYTTYGIQAIGKDGAVAAAYADVSTRKELVQEIVDKCNQLDASVLHLQDIVLDHLD